MSSPINFNDYRTALRPLLENPKNAIKYLQTKDGRALRETLTNVCKKVNECVLHNPKEVTEEFANNTHHLEYAVSLINKIVKQEEDRVSKSFFSRLWAKLFGSVQSVPSISPEVIKKVDNLAVLRKLSDTKDNIQNQFRDAKALWKGGSLFSICPDEYNPHAFRIIREGKEPLRIDVLANTGNLQVENTLYGSFDVLRKKLELGHHSGFMKEVAKLRTPVGDVSEYRQKLQQAVSALGPEKTQDVYALCTSKEWFGDVKKLLGKPHAYLLLLRVDKGTIIEERVTVSEKGIHVGEKIFPNIETLQRTLKTIESIDQQFAAVLQNKKALMSLQGVDIFERADAKQEFDVIVQDLQSEEELLPNISLQGAFLIQPGRKDNELILSVVLEHNQMKECVIIIQDKPDSYLYEGTAYTKEQLKQRLGIKESLGLNALINMRDRAQQIAHSGDFILRVDRIGAGEKLLALMRSCGGAADGAWLIRSDEERPSAVAPRYRYVLSLLHKDNGQYHLEEHPIVLDPETGALKCQNKQFKSLQDLIVQLQAEKMLPFAPQASQEIVVRPKAPEWVSISDLEKSKQTIHVQEALIQKSPGFHEGKGFMDALRYIASFWKGQQRFARPSASAFKTRDQAKEVLEELHKRNPRVGIYVMYPLEQGTESVSFAYGKEKNTMQLSRHVFNFSKIDEDGHVEHMLLDLSKNPGKYTLTDLEGNEQQEATTLDTFTQGLEPFKNEWQKEASEQVLRLKEPEKEAHGEVLRLEAPEPEARVEQAKHEQAKPAPQKPPVQPEPSKLSVQQSKDPVAPKGKKPEPMPREVPDSLKKHKDFQNSDAFKIIAREYHDKGGVISKPSYPQARAFCKKVFKTEDKAKILEEIKRFLPLAKSDGWKGEESRYLQSLFLFYQPYFQAFKKGK